MRNSSNTYLLFLACSDFFVVLTGLFIFWIDSARSYIPQLVQAPYTTVGFSMLLLHWLYLQLAGRICCIENMTFMLKNKCLQVYTLPFGYMAQSCSIYFTVAAAFDCYVCVSFIDWKYT